MFYLILYFPKNYIRKVQQTTYLAIKYEDVIVFNIHGIETCAINTLSIDIF